MNSPIVRSVSRQKVTTHGSDGGMPLCEAEYMTRQAFCGVASLSLLALCVQKWSSHRSVGVRESWSAAQRQFANACAP